VHEFENRIMISVALYVCFIIYKISSAFVVFIFCLFVCL